MMDSSEPIEDSLSQVLQCNVCQERQVRLKIFPCQHTICVECVKNLTVRRNRFHCHVCREEIPVPNGGLEQLPESLIAKQVVDIIKQGEKPVRSNYGGSNSSSQGPQSTVLKTDNSISKLLSGNGAFGFVPRTATKATKPSKSARKKRSGVKEVEKTKKKPNISRSEDSEGNTSRKETTDIDPADIAKLTDDLRKAVETGRRWYRRADEVTDHYSQVLAVTAPKVRHTKQLVRVYQEKLAEDSREKIRELKSILGTHTLEFEELQSKVGPHITQMTNAVETVPEIVEMLASKEHTPKSVADARQHLLELTNMNKAANDEFYAVEDYEELVEGDPVQLKVLDEEEMYEEDAENVVNGKVPFTSIGIFLEHRETLRKELYLYGIPFPLMTMTDRAIFPEQTDWTGKQGRLVKAISKPNLPYKKDRVKVKASVKTLHFSWNGVKAGKSIGILKSVQHDGPDNDLLVIVEFPEDNNWRGLYSEIELVPGCGFEIGDQVWVSRYIPEPSRGWAGVNGSSIGTVRCITGSKGQEEVIVDFPECKGWIGLATELELVKEPQKGDRVQVKLSVKHPLKGWNGVTHEDVGVLVENEDDDENWFTKSRFEFYSCLTKICNYHKNLPQIHRSGHIASIRFPNKPLWRCLISEIELARYQPPTESAEAANQPRVAGTVHDAIQRRMLEDMYQHMFGRNRNF